LFQAATDGEIQSAGLLTLSNNMTAFGFLFMVCPWRSAGITPSPAHPAPETLLFSRRW
jgi:hypothetical protein